MAFDVYPWITKQSHPNANAEFDLALEWLEKVVGVSSRGRFQTYKATFSRVFRRILEDRPDLILDDIPPGDYLEARFEAYALVEVWRQFQADESALLADKLRIVVDGNPLTSDEGSKTQPRDILLNSKSPRF